MADPAVVEIVVRLALAVGLAGLLGAERELADQPAGLRTHALVSLGAALFTVAGTGIAGTDPTRVAAQVVTGVGFLGGGAILREGATVKGLTTAASLWVAAAVGLAAGLGAYGAASAATLVAIVVLFVLKLVEDRLLPRRVRQQVTLHAAEDASLVEVTGQAARLLPTITVRRVSGRAVTMRVRLPHRVDLAELADRMGALPGVTRVEVER
jgi:putative Mg2+ transporter-C (MgtC) family protein